MYGRIQRQITTIQTKRKHCKYVTLENLTKRFAILQMYLLHRSSRYTPKPVALPVWGGFFTLSENSILGQKRRKDIFSAKLLSLSMRIEITAETKLRKTLQAVE